jgi:hypothetical protein
MLLNFNITQDLFNIDGRAMLGEKVQPSHFKVGYSKWATSMVNVFGNWFHGINLRFQRLIGMGALAVI